MPDIKFYHNAPDRLAAVCAIAAKAVRQGRRVVLFAPEAAVAARCDSMLWSAQPLSFIPHVPQSSPLASRTPIVFATDLASAPHADVLINLSAHLPEAYGRFETVVEVVAQDEAARQSARQRWQTYKAQGYTLQAHDLAKPE